MNKATKFANFVFLSSAVGAALLAAYAFVSDAPRFWEVSFIVIFILLVVGLKLPPSARVNLSLVLFSTVFPTFAVETVLDVRAYVNGRSIGQSATAFWLGDESGYDGRSPSEVIENLRNSGINAVPYPSAGLFGTEGFESGGDRVYPLAGISNRTTLMCNESGQWITYESDEHGFHNPLGIWGEGDVDIVAVGDSFTMGYCVASEANFVARIRSVNEKTLNLGWAGTNSVFHFAVIKEFLGDLRPKNVLWVYYEGDDLDHITDTFEFVFDPTFWKIELPEDPPVGLPRLKSYLDDSDYRQLLIDRQSELNSRIEDELARRMLASNEKYTKTSRERNLEYYQIIQIGKLITAKETVRSILTLRNLRGRATSLVYQERTNEHKGYQVATDYLEIMLGDSRDYVATWGGQLQFVYLPAWERYQNDFRGRDIPRISTRDQVIEAAQNLDIPVIDVTEAFDSHSDPLSLWPFRFKAHYNEAGHQLVADTIIDSLRLAE